MTELPWYASLADALLCLLWSAVAVLATRFAVLRAIAFWPKVRDIFGPRGTRLLALVCASVLFMGSVPKFIEVPLRLVYAAVVAVPLGAGQGTDDSASAQATAQVPVGSAQAANEPETLRALGHTARRLISGMGNELHLFRSELPYVQLVFFLIAWFAVAQALKVFFPVADGAGGDDTEAITRVIRSVGVSKGMLVLLLAVGLSLCVAAITAVSELHDKGDPDNQAPAPEELDRRLKASQDSFTEVYPYVASQEDAVSFLAADVLKAQHEAQGSPQQIAKLAQISAKLNFVMSARAQLRSSWEALSKLIQGRYERATQDALTAYVVSSSTRHGVREQRQHFLDIVEWHRQARFDLRSGLERCKREIVSTETAWTMWATDMRLQLAGAAPGSSSSLRDGLLEAESACQAAPLKAVPPRADFGEALGPLKPIAGWLLQTESVQLALIIGMLGAGLLGSAVATFLRSQREQKEAEGQLSGVVVRGVTAAIVVFLAVQGGLSTVAVSATATPPSPNPYLLLLICFVAAVYSEQVWSTARRRLVKQLGSDEEGQESDAPAAGPKAPPALPEPKPAAAEPAEAPAPSVASAPVT